MWVPLEKEWFSLFVSLIFQTTPKPLGKKKKEKT